jgi:dimethylaniline monooxygenase (N-oxide forming)
MTARPVGADVAVIGAGSSGLAVLRALREKGIAVECFEQGSDVGGLWRYENDNGLSGAYASLRTNVSRPRMQYPSFPMPRSYADFPSHRDMARYLGAYAEAFGLREFIRFRASVERLEHVPSGGWCLELDDGTVHSYRAVVVAVGLFWCPKVPDYPGTFGGAAIHSHEYRTPQPFTGRRVLVVGAGQSAAEIAVEVSQVAARTNMSVRSGTHVLPRWIAGKPYDTRDINPLNRIPWRLMNHVYGLRVAQELGPAPASWPQSVRRVLEGIPIISSDLLPAVRGGNVVVKPAIDRLGQDRVRFVDGSEEMLDRIVYCTGYRISLPFLPSSLMSADGRDFPLYRRIVPLDVNGLFFAGFVDAPGGLLPVVEAQGEWIAAVLAGQLILPSSELMQRAMGRAERRTRQRFPGEGPYSIRCDPHAYRRLLHSDLRRVRHLKDAEISDQSQVADGPRLLCTYRIGAPMPPIKAPRPGSEPRKCHENAAG